MTDPIEVHATDLRKVIEAHDLYLEAEYKKIAAYIAAVRKDLTAKSIVVNKRCVAFLKILTAQDKSFASFGDTFYVDDDPLEAMGEFVADEENGPTLCEDALDELDLILDDYHGDAGDDDDDAEEEEIGNEV